MNLAASLATAYQIRQAAVFVMENRDKPLQYWRDKK